MTSVPNISDADRIVDYTPASSTSSFVITWPVIGDTEAAAKDDLVVVVGGTTLRSTDFEFTGTPISGVSGMWNGGTVTLDTAVSGVQVVIYSNRAPRRTGNFLEGKSLPFSTLDMLMDDIAIQLRDIASRMKTGVRYPSHELVDPAVADNELPVKAVRKGFVAKFDDDTGALVNSSVTGQRLEAMSIDMDAAAASAGAAAALTFVGLRQAMSAYAVGITDDPADAVSNTAKLNALLAEAANEHLPVELLPQGNIPLAGQVTIPRNGEIYGLGCQLDFSQDAVTPSYLDHITSSGAIVALPDLADDVTAGTNVLELESEPDVEPGDVVILCSTELWNTNVQPGHEYYRTGEAVIVVEVDGTSLYLLQPTLWNYAAAQTSLGKMRQNNLVLDDFSVAGGSGYSAIRLSHMGPSARVGLRRIDGGLVTQGIYIDRAYGTRVDVRDAYAVQEGSTNCYPVFIGNSTGVRVFGREMVTSWQCGIGGDGPPFNITNEDCRVVGIRIHQVPNTSQVPVCDMHGNTHNCGYQDCEITGGVAMGGDNNFVTGRSTIVAGSKYGLSTIAILLSEPLSLNHRIGHEVKIWVASYTGSPGYGIVFDADTPNGGINHKMQGGTFVFEAECEYQHTAGIHHQYIINVYNNDCMVPGMRIDLSNAVFICRGNEALTGGGIFIRNGATEWHGADIQVSLPKRRSTWNGDFRYIDGTIDMRNCEMDCIGLGDVANIRLLSCPAKVLAQGVVARGGDEGTTLGYFFYTDQGATFDMTMTATGMTISGYAQKAMKIDSGGSLTFGFSDLGELGVELDHLASVHYVPGATDGTVTHTTVVDFKTAQFA